MLEVLTRPHVGRSVCTLSMTVLIAACSAGSGGEGDASVDGGTSMAGVTRIVAREGGVAVSADGLLELNVPPNALEEDTTISIRPVNPDEAPARIRGLAERVYELLPDGLRFRMPVGLAWRQRRVVADDEGIPLITAFTFDERNGLEVVGAPVGETDSVQRLTIDRDDTVLEGSISHFSWVFYRGAAGVRLGLQHRPSPLGSGPFTASYRFSNARRPNGPIAVPLRIDCPASGNIGGDVLRGTLRDRLGESNVDVDWPPPRHLLGECRYICNEGDAPRSRYEVFVAFTVDGARPLDEEAEALARFLGIDASAGVEFARVSIPAQCGERVPCCSTDGCEERTLEECEERGGDSIRDGLVSCSACTGACCLDSGACRDDVESRQCTGTARFFRSRSCEPELCESFVGGCCTRGGFCTAVTDEACDGEFFTTYAACEAECEPTDTGPWVACCTRFGCNNVPEDVCDESGTRAPGNTCQPDTCPSSCCLPDGICVPTPPDGQACFNARGTPVPNVCGEVTCETRGACCRSDGRCTSGEESECPLDAIFSAGLACSETDCPNVRACCAEDGACTLVPPSECEGTPQDTPYCLESGCAESFGACCTDFGCMNAVVRTRCPNPDEQFFPTSSCAEVSGCDEIATGCCLPEGGCLDAIPSACRRFGGTSDPINGCDAAACGPQPGACCTPTGCVEADEQESCGAREDGTFFEGQSCVDACSETATGCCLPGGGCEDLVPSTCIERGGSVDALDVCADASCGGFAGRWSFWFTTGGTLNQVELQRECALGPRFGVSRTYLFHPDGAVTRQDNRPVLETTDAGAAILAGAWTGDLTSLAYTSCPEASASPGDGGRTASLDLTRFSDTEFYGVETDMTGNMRGVCGLRVGPEQTAPYDACRTSICTIWNQGVQGAPLARIPDWLQPYQDALPVTCGDDSRVLGCCMGTACSVASVAACEAGGGTPIGTATCGPGVCENLGPCYKDGRCSEGVERNACVADEGIPGQAGACGACEASDACFDRTAGDCTGTRETHFPGEMCGRCELPAECDNLRAATCSARGGTFTADAFCP